MTERLLTGATVGLIIGVSVAYCGLPERRLSVAGVEHHRVQDAIDEGNPGQEFEEWVIIYIGSANCLQSNHPDIPAQLRRLQGDLVGALNERVPAARVTMVGVDLHPVVGAELSHLNWAGSFDQISLGGSYLNWVASYVTWHPFEGAPGVPTPHVTVVRRKFQRLSERGTAVVLSLTEERIMGRRYGLQRLESWSMDELVRRSTQ